MKRMGSLLTMICSIIFLTGCSQVTEVARTWWGSSTRVLENERDNALTKTYICTFDECFDEILTLARSKKVYLEEANEEREEREESEGSEEESLFDLEKDKHKEDDGVFDVFSKDKIRAHIVVIGIKGNIDTTEVGIFFDELTGSAVKIDISSLSSSAKEKVAGAVFKKLSDKFQEVN